MRAWTVKLMNALLQPFGFACLRAKDHVKNQMRERIFHALLIYHQSRPSAPPPASLPLVEGMVFSRDRACQLHALLTSFFDQTRGEVPLRILFSASNQRHAQAYDSVQACFRRPNLAWIHERDFKADLLSALRQVSCRWIFFLVDDLVFVRPVDFAFLQDLSPGVVVPSLRLGAHLNHCYTKKKSMDPPPFHSQSLSTATDGMLAWSWEQGRLDWGYPLSLDGHLFDPEEIRRIAELSTFSRPNSFERALQLANPLFRSRQGLCFRESRVVNLPINRVQTEQENIHGEVHQTILLEKWEQGLQIDFQKFYGIQNRSAHQELPVSFVPRGGNCAAPVPHGQNDEG
jgi:hypothetical protein